MIEVRPLVALFAIDKDLKMLNPCPFCGGTNITMLFFDKQFYECDYDYPYIKHIYIKCKDCDVLMHKQSTHENQSAIIDALVKQWNDRWQKYE